MSTPAAVLSRTSLSSEDTALSEGLTLADLLDVLGAAEEAVPAENSDAHESRGPGLRERMQAWTDLAAAWGAGPQGSWRAW